jgi:hypothetical protein
MDIHCGSLRSTYRVNVPWSGHFESTHRGSSLTAGPGTAVLYQPEGDAGSRWAAGSRLLSIRIDRSAVEDALSDSLGRQLTSQIDFTSGISMRSTTTQSWINMLSLFAEQLFRRDSILNQPMVGLPFVDSLVRGLLLAAEHPYRSWGFTNLGRFAAAHTARYDEPPAATLRRLAYRGIQSNIRHAG